MNEKYGGRQGEGRGRRGLGVRGGVGCSRTPSRSQIHALRMYDSSKTIKEYKGSKRGENTDESGGHDINRYILPGGFPETSVMSLDTDTVHTKIKNYNIFTLPPHILTRSTYMKANQATKKVRIIISTLFFYCKLIKKLLFGMTRFNESHEIYHITQEYKEKYNFILHNENEAYFMAIKNLHKE